MEVDLSRLGQRFLVPLENRSEHGEEGFGPRPVRRVCSASRYLRKCQLSALVMVQKGRQQAYERIDPTLCFKDGESLGRRERRQGDAVGLEFRRQVPGQCAGGTVRG